MDLPDTLAELIESARRWLSLAERFNMSARAESAAAELATLRSYVVPTPELNFAIEEALIAIRNVADIGHDPFRLTRRGTVWAEQLRQLAFMAIDRLVYALGHAKPSEQARAVGLDWF